jgi:hypothetical protein
MDGVGKSESPEPGGNLTTGRRETQRARVQLAATLAGTTREYPVTLRNISCTGAMVEGGSLPPKGWTVALKRGSMDELGDVVWTRGSFCGIHFFDPVPYEMVLELAALPPEAPAHKIASHYVAPTSRDDKLSAEEWARAKLRASRMQR